MQNFYGAKAFEFVQDYIKTSLKIASNFTENFNSYINDDKDILLTYLNFYNKLLLNPKEFIKINKNLQIHFGEQQELFRRIIHTPPGKKFPPVVAPEAQDRRFNAPEWNELHFDLIRELYLMNSRFILKNIEEVEPDEKRKRKLIFYSKHFLEAFSPSNFIPTNPEVLKRIMETRGENLLAGFKNLMEDIQKGKITQTDEAAFQVGKNLAITKGQVVFRNEIMELIRYTPSTETVYEIPIMIVPPWINKYYVLDLQPHNSLVKFAVDQGFQVFMISWRNPTQEMGNLKFDDYVESGTLTGIDVTREISGSSEINVMGYCLGGTLLGVTLAILAAQKKNIIKNICLLATMLDFTDVGPMGDVIDEALIKKMERGEILHNGVMSGFDMERAFNLIRSNDLVWTYVINNYLKGLKPPPFDVLYWTNDNTNLPGKMYLFYLREIVFKNNLVKRNVLRISGMPVNISKVNVPALIIATQEDHISPARTTFASTELLKGPVEFILSESGHVMGIANPPDKKKYGYYSGGILEEGFDEWRKTARRNEGSWWPAWSRWISERSGIKIIAEEKKSIAGFPGLGPAPGIYVLQKCEI